MGNLIKDFWVYQNYYGITEVVGGPLEFRKAENKYETRIEKAIAYMMKPGLKLLSHMSVQTYNTYLNKDNRASRNEDEKAYYPMIIELETKVKPDSFELDHKGMEMKFDMQYREMIAEAYLLVTYLIYEKGMEEKDILIMLNNSRSIYILMNPVSYGLKPAKDLHKVYNEMYNILAEDVSLVYADKQMYKSNGLMKTPNAWYKDGYFVPISYNELKQLQKDPGLKSKLTRNKRTLDYDIPGISCPAISEIYETARDRANTHELRQIKSSYLGCSAGETKKIVYMPGQRSCTNYIHKNEIEDGRKNFALVALAYHYKSQGYTQEQTYEILQTVADKWNYETPNRIKAKAKSVFRGTKKFCCDKAKECLGLEDICNNCQFNSNRNNVQPEGTRFKIQKVVIDSLWRNKASLRHYKALLQLSRKSLYNKWFSLEAEGLSKRTIKELCKLSGESFIFSQNGDSVMVYTKVDYKTQYCMLPNAFWDQAIYNQFGEQLKHYLKIIFTGYKISKNGKYINSRVGMKRIQELLNYETLNGVYKFLQKLRALGFAIINKGKLFAIYFESFKIINIEDGIKKGKSVSAKYYMDENDVDEPVGFNEKKVVDTG